MAHVIQWSTLQWHGSLRQGTDLLRDRFHTKLLIAEFFFRNNWQEMAQYDQLDLDESYYIINRNNNNK